MGHERCRRKNLFFSASSSSHENKINNDQKKLKNSVAAVENVALRAKSAQQRRAKCSRECRRVSCCILKHSTHQQSRLLVFWHQNHIRFSLDIGQFTLITKENKTTPQFSFYSTNFNALCIRETCTITMEFLIKG